MALKVQFDERRLQWEAFNRWEERLPPTERDGARILADLGVIVSWISPEDRLLDPDPQKRGIQILRAAFASVRK